MIFKIKEKVKGKEMIFVQLYAITYLSNNYHHHHHHHHQANENEMKSKRKEKEILFKTKNHDDF